MWLRFYNAQIRFFIPIYASLGGLLEKHPWEFLGDQQTYQ